jgi:hypothetical protein
MKMYRRQQLAIAKHYQRIINDERRKLKQSKEKKTFFAKLFGRG